MEQRLAKMEALVNALVNQHNGRLESEQEAAKKQQEEAAKAEAAKKAREEYMGRVKQSLNGYAGQDELGGAYEHLTNAQKKRQAFLRGREPSEDEISDSVNEHMNGVFQDAIKRGIDPARALIQSAVDMGYTRKQAENMAEEQLEGGGENMNAASAARSEQMPEKGGGKAGQAGVRAAMRRAKEGDSEYFRRFMSS